eukprot:COSAG03_NODE_2495_length_2705_cov_2.073292_3_plen_55_part_01
MMVEWLARPTLVALLRPALRRVQLPSSRHADALAESWRGARFRHIGCLMDPRFAY